jgi:histidine ammonia-lyase
MGPAAARKCSQVAHLVGKIIHLEMICAAQALDFLKPLRPGRGVEAAYLAVRKCVPFLTKDTYMGDHLKIEPVDLISAVEKAVGRIL